MKATGKRVVSMYKRIGKLAAVTAMALALMMGQSGAARAEEDRLATPVSEFLTSCWELYDVYDDFVDACKEARYLRRCGYETRIRYCDGIYYVYYR
jgi:hypothetical protein